MSSDPLFKNSLTSNGPPIAAPGEARPSEAPSIAGFSGLLSIQGILDRIRALRAVLRLKPFDTSTDQGRSQERYRRAALTTVTSVLARCVTVTTSLITVRLTLLYLGTERYGLWMTITSVVSLLWFADLGIGNGLLNAIAEARGRDDTESVRRYVSSAFFVLSGVGVLLLALLALAYPFVPWPRVFNVSTSLAAREAGPAVLGFLGYCMLNLPLDVVQRVQTGHQEGFATNFWIVIGNVAGLGCLILALHQKRGLPWLILAFLGGQLFGIICNWIYEFGLKHPEFIPGWTHWDMATARKIMGTGSMFLILQTCAIFVIPLDNFVITQILGPEAVTQYAVPMRLFILVTSIASMFVMPLWPAYGEAAARGDVKWVKSTFYHSLGYSALIFGPAALSLAVFGKLIVRIWVGAEVQPTYALLFGMAVWTILFVVSTGIFMFLCGINDLKFLVVISILQSAANLILKVIMAKAFGLVGVIWASVLVFLIVDALLMIHVSNLVKSMGTNGEG